jgi:hypothetical protein
MKHPASVVLWGLIACLIGLVFPALYAKSAPKMVDLDRLLAKPESFDGKMVRVRGFLMVSLPANDVGVIAFCVDENEAMNFSRSHRCVLVSRKNAQVRIDRSTKSSWVEITARFITQPVAHSNERMKGLAEIRELEEIPEKNLKP